MAERKGLNKYYPPDFDPAKIPKRKKPKNNQVGVRNMLPMNIRCSVHAEIISTEAPRPIFVKKTLLARFYLKCKHCSAEITLTTDPQNLDYTVESGASRNIEPSGAKDEVANEKRRRRNAEERGDAMRSLDSKGEMDILAGLDELKSMKKTQIISQSNSTMEDISMKLLQNYMSRHATVSADVMLQVLQHSNPKEEDKSVEEDEALIKSISRGSQEVVRRINDEELEEDDFTVSTMGNCKSLNHGSKEGQSNPLQLKEAELELIRGKSLLNNATSFNVKRRREDDVVTRTRFVVKPRLQPERADHQPNGGE